MDPHTRRMLFIWACIPSRAVLAALPAWLPAARLKYLAVVTGILAVGFLFLYFTDGRMEAVEAGGQTWWGSLRLLHGMLYLCATIYLLQGDRLASLPLGLDILTGAGAFVHHHFVS